MTIITRCSTLAVRSVSVTSSGQGAVRALSTKPKLHNANIIWKKLKSDRPIDHDDLHLTFHPPYSGATLWGLTALVWITGVGSVTYGFIHQQYKQGYWK